MILYCATTNAGKLREFRLTLRDGVTVETRPGLEAMAACEETGASFEENAIQKALYYSAGVAGYLFAEDSGLEVAALGGAPGIYSARFARPGATDEDNNRLLIERMKGARDRRARYVCVAALARDGKLAGTFRGEVEGTIVEEPRGSNGFGYDPLFYYEPFGCTFGETEAPRKIEVSHRTRAVRAMLDALRKSASS